MAVGEGGANGSERLLLAVLDDGHLAREVDDAGRRVVEDELLRAVAVPVDLAQLQRLEVTLQRMCVCMYVRGQPCS